jgi:3-hydroxy acid dehydrogenase/malonic semialdehyde reductase
MPKTALITGASSGFGEACARAFSAAGYSVILVARSLEKLQQLAVELRENNAVHIAQVDMMNAASVAAFVDTLPAGFQAIDVLVNNAGLALGMAPAQETELDDWEVMVDTNIKGLMRITHHLLPGMVERNRGHIINMGSIAGNWPYPGGNVYGATKAFVQQFSRNLRADLIGKNIRVTNLEPGMAETRFSIVRMKGDREKADQVYHHTQPLTAGDIADIVLWVASLPPHVNINTLEVMPTCQSWGPFAVDRTME